MDWAILILGMALVTYLTRVTPFFVKIEDSRYIKYVPSSVFAALVFPDVLSSAEKLVAGVVVFAIAYRKSDLLVAFVTGVGVLYVLHLL
ncbi:AzlD domain-containing protein [Geoglobus sp.]